MTRYRVWCLSWGETETDGIDVDHKTSSEILNEVAEIAAGQYVDNGDHETLKGWPLTFRVRAPSGEVQDFRVELDWSPTFCAWLQETP